MRQPAGAVEAFELALGGLMADQIGVGPRRQYRALRLGCRLNPAGHARCQFSNGGSGRLPAIRPAPPRHPQPLPD